DELGVLPGVAGGAGAAPGARIAAGRGPPRASARDARIALRDAEPRTANEARVARIVGGAGAAVGAAVTPGVPSGSPVRVTVAAACVTSVARRRDEQRDERSPKTATSTVPARLHGYVGSQGTKGIATLETPRTAKI